MPMSGVRRPFTPARLLGAVRRRPGPGRRRGATAADLAHLSAFVAEHGGSSGGVEAYLEPPTTVTETTIVLVADTGQWTRRRVDDARQARRFADEHKIPMYDAQRVGYPPRMRAWSHAQRAAAGAGRTRPGGAPS